MELVITSVPLDEALKRQGKDWRNMSRNEMRSLVCAQCHVEYYFQDPEYSKGGQKVKGVNRKPVFPWDLGMEPATMYEYYNAHGAVTMAGFEGKVADWIHPVSKTPMIKLQHPEYEAWSNSPHGAAGVSCADCHMAYTRVEGKKISSHQVTTPLKTPGMIDAACRQCHADKSPEYLRARVEYTQDKTFENLLKAQDMSVKAHEAVRQALEWTGAKHANYDKLIIDAKEMVRKGQFYWDWVSAENSVGFHNPPLLLDTLFKSVEFSQEAVNAAMQATNYGIAPMLEGDVKKIVTPILEWNREMHMDPAIKKQHAWTTYLPDIPKAERMWKGQDKIR
jgi:nitrite reductase (cytochrome c-552)